MVGRVVLVTTRDKFTVDSNQANTDCSCLYIGSSVPDRSQDLRTRFENSNGAQHDDNQGCSGVIAMGFTKTIKASRKILLCLNVL